MDADRSSIKKIKVKKLLEKKVNQTQKKKLRVTRVKS